MLGHFRVLFVMMAFRCECKRFCREDDWFCRHGLHCAPSLSSAMLVVFVVCLCLGEECRRRATRSVPASTYSGELGPPNERLALPASGEADSAADPYLLYCKKLPTLASLAGRMHLSTLAFRHCCCLPTATNEAAPPRPLLVEKRTSSAVPPWPTCSTPSTASSPALTARIRARNSSSRGFLASRFCATSTCNLPSSLGSTSLWASMDESLYENAACSKPRDQEAPRELPKEGERERERLTRSATCRTTQAPASLPKKFATAPEAW